MFLPEIFTGSSAPTAEDVGEPRYPPYKQEKATQTVLQQAELLCADWAEAS